MALLFVLSLVQRPELDQRHFSELVFKYESLYIPKLTGDSWTASSSSSTCDHGSHSAVDRSDALNRIRYFRWLVGLSTDVRIDDQYTSAQAQCAASLQQLGYLTHQIDPGDPCYTKAGSDAAKFSNLFQRGVLATSSGAIEMFMDDYGTPTVGHRLAMINSEVTAYGLGQNHNFVALRVFDVPGSPGWSHSLARRLRAASDSFVAYPPGGPSMIDRMVDWYNGPVDWSFQRWYIDEEDVGAVEITRADGLAIPATAEHIWDTQMPGSRMSMVRIQLSCPNAHIAAGYQYRVRLTIAGEVYEWYPYFLSYSSETGWENTTTMWFPGHEANQPKGNDQDKDKGLSGGAVAAIVIVVLLVVAGAAVGVFWWLKNGSDAPADAAP
jgi:hypothetical protein